MIINSQLFKLNNQFIDEFKVATEKTLDVSRLFCVVLENLNGSKTIPGLLTPVIGRAILWCMLTINDGSGQL